MSQKHKHTAVTAHGEIEYETVECANCESKVREENAVGVGVDVKYQYSWRRSVKHARRRNLCPYCAESIFGHNQSRYGGVSTGVVAPMLERMRQVEDPFFMLMFAAIGTLIGFGAFAAIYAVLGAVL